MNDDYQCADCGNRVISDSNICRCDAVGIPTTEQPVGCSESVRLSMRAAMALTKKYLGMVGVKEIGNLEIAELRETHYQIRNALHELERTSKRKPTQPIGCYHCGAAEGHWHSQSCEEYPIQKCTREDINLSQPDAAIKAVPERETGALKYASVHMALRRLVLLKEHKDKHGKDGYYEEEQPYAWKQARTALTEIEGEK